jgi:hypothetical protein
MRTFPILLLVAFMALPASPANAALSPAHKATGVADQATLDVTLTSPTTATLRLDQTWEGMRAQDMRQSLDAYFGNGDKTLTPPEIAKVTAAAMHDMANQSYPGILLDGQPSRVEGVAVTLDGAAANDTTTPLTIHHEVQLLETPAAGESHVFALTPLWNGTFAIHVLPGQAFPGGNPTAEGGLVAGNQVLVTFGPAAAAAPTAAPAAPTPAAAAAPTPVPQAVVGPPHRSVPTLGVGALVAAVVALAFLQRRTRSK